MSNFKLFFAFSIGKMGNDCQNPFCNFFKKIEINIFDLVPCCMMVRILIKRINQDGLVSSLPEGLFITSTTIACYNFPGG
jgi:hypothetical protein